MGEQVNTILDKTQDEVLEEYKSYANVLEGGSLKDKPWFWNRLGPIFYETPYGSTVLDFGCNAGDFVELLEKDRGCKSFGIDISEICVKEAKEKGRNVELYDGKNIPFPDNYFDVVYLNEVLIHVYDQEAVLKEIKRVLKPTGFLLGSTPHKNLQTRFWEESFSHHDYPTEKDVTDKLLGVFDKAYLRVLNGAQFSFTMAQSSVGNEPAEILFKAGGKSTKPWEESLLDKSVLRVWMGFTAPPADVYYRMSGYADKMRELGDEIAYEPYSHDDLSSTSRWQGKVLEKHVQYQFDALMRAADLSVWQIVHTLQCVAFLRCIKDVFKKPVVTEIDDWLFDVPSSNLASNPYKPNSDMEWCAYEQIKLSDHIIVSTKYLKESLLEMFPEKKIHIVPNSIDFKIWDEIEIHETIPKKKEGNIRIVYTGCGNHNGDVEIVKRPLLSLLEEFPNLEIVWPMQFESWKDINHERIHYVNKWLPLTKYPGMIKGWNSDIGIAPLRDNNLNRSKSNLRWLEFSALKIPSVVSKVQPFQESVVDGKTGYIANNQRDWYEKLKILIEHKSERVRIGKDAYMEVKRNFNMDKVAKDYRKILQGIKRGL